MALALAISIEGDNRGDNDGFAHLRLAAATACTLGGEITRRRRKAPSRRRRAGAQEKENIRAAAPTSA